MIVPEKWGEKIFAQSEDIHKNIRKAMYDSITTEGGHRYTKGVLSTTMALCKLLEEVYDILDKEVRSSPFKEITSKGIIEMIEICMDNIKSKSQEYDTPTKV